MINTVTKLRDELQTLTSEIQRMSGTAGADGALSFVPSFISASQLALTEISDGLEQLIVDDQSADAISLSEASSQLNDFIDGFRSIYAGSVNAQLPSWMNRTRETPVLDFYAAFFAGMLALSTDVLTKMNSVLLVSSDVGQEIYATWLQNRTDTGTGAELSRRRALAYTMRHIAEEALDLYGYTHEDIVRLLAAAPAVTEPAAQPVADPVVA